MDQSSNTILHKIEVPEKKNNIRPYITLIIIILFGTLSGFILSKSMNSKSSTQGNISSTVNKDDKKATSKDNKIFPDQAEGDLQSGGINGEGTHKLIRPGGESQNVYLTSSVMDLSQYEGKKVRVWGETRAAKKAGWLMDVGKVEILQ
jgi:hypothetical protein